MANDFSEWDKAFDKLAGPVKESLARRMGVSGGQVMRDEAKLQAPVGVAEEQAIRQYGGSIKPGALRDAIYLAYNDKLSNNVSYTYSISWNSSKERAPHGHLVEFGHLMTHQVIFSPEKGWHTLKDKPLANPKWIPGNPFLSRAYDISLGRAYTAAIERGRVELPALLRESQ